MNDQVAALMVQSFRAIFWIPRGSVQCETHVSHLIKALQHVLNLFFFFTFHEKELYKFKKRSQ